jgi:hypothetical protein
MAAVTRGGWWVRSPTTRACPVRAVGGRITLLGHGRLRPHPNYRSAGQLDTPSALATLPRPPERGARKVLRLTGAPSLDPDTTFFVARRIGGLLREQRPFRCPPSPASVLENSTACVCDEKRRPPVSGPASAGRMRTTSLSRQPRSTVPVERGMTPFELELEGRQQFACSLDADPLRGSVRARQPVSSRRV